MGELAKPEFATSEKVRSLPDIDALEIVADWREDLTMRIRRARLRQEFDGVSPEEIMALSAETRAEADELADKALAAGGSQPKEPKDHGFMYVRTFTDLDGHHWEVLAQG